MRLAELDAVTLDAYGTLLRLADPVPALRAALAEHRIHRSGTAVRAAFAAEVAYYRPRSLAGSSPEALAELRRDSVCVFLGAVGTDLPAEEFAPAFLGSLRFELLPWVHETLAQLRSLGLALAVVSNWDVSLLEVLAGLGLGACFDAVVASADVGAEKPSTAIFEAALGRLGVAPSRAVHVGDDPADETGALASGMSFAPAPLPDLIPRLR